MTGERFMVRMLLMLTGLLAWAVQFAVLYGTTSLVCARRLEATVFGLPTLAAVSAVISLIALVAIVLAIRASGRWSIAPTGEGGPDPFLRAMTLAVGLLSVTAVVFTGLPSFTMPACETGTIALPPIG